MTGDELKNWKSRLGLSNAEAAWYLGLTLQGLQNQLYAARPVSERTEHLCGVIEHLLTQPETEPFS